MTTHTTTTTEVSMLTVATHEPTMGFRRGSPEMGHRRGSPEMVRHRGPEMGFKKAPALGYKRHPEAGYRRGSPAMVRHRAPVARGRTRCGLTG